MWSVSEIQKPVCNADQQVKGNVILYLLCVCLKIANYEFSSVPLSFEEQSLNGRTLYSDHFALWKHVNEIKPIHS